MYDYLIVGSGLYGATFAFLARKAGKRCLVIDRRPQLGGNLYCDDIDGILAGSELLVPLSRKLPEASFILAGALGLLFFGIYKSDMEDGLCDNSLNDYRLVQEHLGKGAKIYVDCW